MYFLYSNLSNKRHVSLIIYFRLCHACRSNWLGVVNYLFRFLPCVSLITKVSLNNFYQFHNWQKTHFCSVPKKVFAQCGKKFLHKEGKNVLFPPIGGPSIVYPAQCARLYIHLCLHFDACSFLLFKVVFGSASPITNFSCMHK